MSSPRRILLVDIGNSRTKWRIVCPEARIDINEPGGAVENEDWGRLRRDWGTYKNQLSGALVSCVGREEIYAHLDEVVRDLTGRPSERFASTANMCGLHNGYANPGQLGTDRWAAALGAHLRYSQDAIIIATFGTATTLDVVVPADIAGRFSRRWRRAVPSPSLANAIFLGGAILPGFNLMRQSLAKGTAQLPMAHGQYSYVADNTDDAITSGIAHAQAGALERIFSLISLHAGKKCVTRCVISGGAGSHVIELLTGFPIVKHVGVEENLVLEGLRATLLERR